MKKKILSLLLAAFMVLGALPLAVFSILAADDAPEMTYDYDDLYVRDIDGDGEDDIAFLWDAFDVTADTEVTGVLVNRVEDGADITYDSAKAKAHDGFMTFYQIMAFGNTLSTHNVTAGGVEYRVDEDASFELLIAQDPTVQMQPLNTPHVSPVTGTGYQAWGLYTFGGNFAGFNFYAKNQNEHTMWENNSPYNESYGYVSGGWRAHAGTYGTAGDDSTYVPDRTINYMVDNVYSYVNDGERRMFGDIPGSPFALTSTVKMYISANGYTGRGHVQFYRNGAEMSPFIDSDTGRWMGMDKDVLLTYTATKAAEFPAPTSGTARMAFGHEIGFAFYAVRLYDGVLSEKQIAQNHFADLLGYHGVPVAREFMEAGEDAKQAVYDAFADVACKNTTVAEIERAMQDVVALDYAADDILVFDGYQVRTNTYPGLRTRFTVNKDALKDGAVLKEAGLLLALAEGREVTDLTVVSGAEGYEAANEVVLTKIYDGNVWHGVFERQNVSDLNNIHVSSHVVRTVTFKEAAEQTAAKYQTKLIFRGYVVITVRGVDYVWYTDMTGELFPDAKVSLYDVAKLTHNLRYDINRQVVDMVEN